MTTWIDTTKHTTTWADSLDFLLQEMGSFLLLEDGGKIIVEPTIDAFKSVTSWIEQNKS